MFQAIYGIGAPTDRTIDQAEQDLSKILLDYFGGASIKRGHGVWRSDDTHTDYSEPDFTAFVGTDKQDDLPLVASIIADRFAQESVYLAYWPVTIQFVDSTLAQVLSANVVNEVPVS